MFKAQKLKQQSIIEYIIYMFQIENVIRVFDCSLDKIYNNLLSQYDVSGKQALELRNWYEMLILQLKSLDSNKDHFPFIITLIEKLDNIHQHILGADNSQYSNYKSSYTSVVLILQELRHKLHLSNNSDVYVAVYAVYIYATMKSAKKTISDETNKSMRIVVNLLNQLAFFYHKDIDD